MLSKFVAAMMSYAMGFLAGAEAPPEQQPPTAEADQAETRPADPQTQQTTDPEAMKILENLEAAGAEHQALRAELKYEVIDRLTGDSEEREGKVFFRGQSDEEPEKFRISFRTLRQAGGPRIAERVDYAFDGKWLTVARHRTKQMTRYQVVPDGEQARPMELGRGPFPIPFGQRAEDVVRHFHVSTRDRKEDEPEGTDYLKLVTRDEYAEQIAFTQLEMWVCEQRHLPVKLISRDKNERITTAGFEEIETDVELDDDIFHLPRPAGWQYSEERLEQSGGPQMP